MGKRIEFICLGRPILLIYERLINSESVHPTVCFDKNSRTLIPFEKGNFENLQAVIDQVYWILTSSQVKEFLESLETATFNRINKSFDFQNPTEGLRF